MFIVLQTFSERNKFSSLPLYVLQALGPEVQLKTGGGSGVEFFNEKALILLQLLLLILLYELSLLCTDACILICWLIA